LEDGSDYECDIDFGRELAVLHCVLRDCLSLSNFNEVFIASVASAQTYAVFPLFGQFLFAACL